MPIDIDREAGVLRGVLTRRGLTHLGVIKRGKALIVQSGPAECPEPEARLVHLAGRSWRLDLRHHAERWEQTPFIGDLAELVDAALGIGRLADDRGAWAGNNPADTSDPSH